MKLSTPQERTRWLAFVEAQALPLEVSCEPWRPERTIPQNRYLWRAVYQPLVDRLGFSKDEWHEHYCIEYFGSVEHFKPSGAVEIKPLRTTTKNEHNKRDVLKGKAFGDFVTFVEEDCARRGVFIVEEWGEAA